MSSNYPSSLDNLINPSPTDALNSPTNPHHLQHANANDAIEALQTVLGVLPAGSFLTVKERIAAYEALSGLKDVTITSVASGDVLRYNGSKWSNYSENHLTDGGNF
jgi:hypothetical protein